MRTDPPRVFRRLHRPAAIEAVEALERLMDELESSLAARVV